MFMLPEEPRVLIVTGDEWRRVRMLRLLERGGYRVQVAASPREAFHALALWGTPLRPLPDLILVDQANLGTEAQMVIRSVQNAELGVRMVVLAAFGAADDVIGCLRAGAADYISLPARPQQILAVLGRVLAVPNVV